MISTTKIATIVAQTASNERFRYQGGGGAGGESGLATWV
jgi:hypothetical protein